MYLGIPSYHGLDSILQVASFVRSSGLVIGDDNGFILIS